MKPVAEEIYYMPSDSNPDKLYEVTLGEFPHCNCPDWAIKRNRLKQRVDAEQLVVKDLYYTCKHVKRAAAMAGHVLEPPEPPRSLEELRRMAAEIVAHHKVVK